MIKALEEWLGRTREPATKMLLPLILRPGTLVFFVAVLFVAVKSVIHWGSIDLTPFNYDACDKTTLALNLKIAPLYRLVAAISLIAILVWASGRLRRSIRHWFEQKWWDIGKRRPDQKLSWADVFRLASLAPGRDPVAMADPAVLISRGREGVDADTSTEAPDVEALDVPVRTQAAGAAIAVFLALIVIGGIVALAADYILFPRVPNLVFFDSDLKEIKAGHLIAASGNLTAYLALLAAAVSIYFTYQQLRAKVRADSRQAWINELRVLLSNIILKIGNHFKDGKLDRDEFDDLNRARLHLELMLNPSEKDHRLLTLLIRRCVIPEIVIEGDDIIARQIRRDREIGDMIENYFVGSEASQRILWQVINKEIAASSEGDKVISFIVKLTHVVLKREWERVRHTR